MPDTDNWWHLILTTVCSRYLLSVWLWMNFLIPPRWSWLKDDLSDAKAWGRDNHSVLLPLNCPWETPSFTYTSLHSLPMTSDLYEGGWLIDGIILVTWEGNCRLIKSQQVHGSWSSWKVASSDAISKHPPSLAQPQSPAPHCCSHTLSASLVQVRLELC